MGIYNKAEWEIGSSMSCNNIFIRLKIGNRKKFVHDFMEISQAEEFALDILKIITKLKEKACGTCIYCKENIINEEIYYVTSNGEKIHKRCLGDYMEKHTISGVLEKKQAKKVNINELKIKK